MKNAKEKVNTELEKLCRYCDPPVPHEQCPGHSIGATNENRFMKDKSFVDGARFELE